MPPAGKGQRSSVLTGTVGIGAFSEIRILVGARNKTCSLKKKEKKPCSLKGKKKIGFFKTTRLALVRVRTTLLLISTS